MKLSKCVGWFVPPENKHWAHSVLTCQLLAYLIRKYYLNDCSITEINKIAASEKSAFIDRCHRVVSVDVWTTFCKSKGVLGFTSCPLLHGSCPVYLLWLCGKWQSSHSILTSYIETTLPGLLIRFSNTTVFATGKCCLLLELADDIDLELCKWIFMQYQCNVELAVYGIIRTWLYQMRSQGR